MSSEEALAALASGDWSGAEVETEPRPARGVYSVRLRGLAERFEAEAARRGVSPSTLLRMFVEEKLGEPVDGDAVVTVRVADLHRAIDQVAGKAA